MFPFIDTAPRASPPVLVLALILINTLVFLWMQSLPADALEQVLVHAALIPVRYTEPLVARQYGLDPSNWWPLLTNTFMHGGWLHLILNMWFLWIFGPAMEARFGRLGFAALYLAGAVAASAVHLFTHPGSTTPVLGASGAIAAVLGACGRLPADARDHHHPHRVHSTVRADPSGGVRGDLVRTATAAGHVRTAVARNGGRNRLVGPHRRLCLRGTLCARRTFTRPAASRADDHLERAGARPRANRAPAPVAAILRLANSE